MTTGTDSERLDATASAPGCSLRLTAEERRAREDAVRFADASLGLSGFKVSAEARTRSDRFIAGEIDLAEFVNGK